MSVKRLWKEWRPCSIKSIGNDKKPRSFGTSELLHQSEIHFIDAIGIDSEIKRLAIVQKAEHIKRSYNSGCG